MSGAPALYVGAVTHRRLRPKRHSLRYRVYWLLLDIDRLEAVTARLRFFSLGRFNLFSFCETDHAERTGPLRPQVERRLAEAGLPAGGPIHLFCMPRILGFGFNPLSVYFCHDGAGALVAILYEVRNTFGERHSYLIPAGAGRGAVEQACDKGFYVSPFLGMDMRYRFRVEPPGAGVKIAVQASDCAGVALTAVLSGERRDLTDAALLRVFVTHPLLTLKVVAAINWNALKMLAKGFRWLRRPPPPAAPVTIVADAGSRR